MARALWKGSITFGLVNIPIELHTAVRDQRPHFRMLPAKDKSPVRFERVCIRDGHPVAWEDLVEGFQYEQGRLVDMAKALVNSLAAEWDPAKYADQYRENLMRIIQGKLKGKDVTLEAPEEPRQAEVVDLMERLRRSLAQSGEGGRRARAAGGERRTQAAHRPSKPRARKKSHRAA